MVLEVFSNLNNSGILFTLGAHSWDMEEQELEALIHQERWEELNLSGFGQWQLMGTRRQAENISEQRGDGRLLCDCWELN